MGSFIAVFNGNKLVFFSGNNFEELASLRWLRSLHAGAGQTSPTSSPRSSTEKTETLKICEKFKFKIVFSYSFNRRYLTLKCIFR